MNSAISTEPNLLANIHPAYLPLLLAELNATALNFDPPDQEIYLSCLLDQMATFPAPGEPEQPAVVVINNPTAPGVTERVLLALMAFLNRVQVYREESPAWQVTALAALKLAQDQDEEDDGFTEAEWAAARHARRAQQFSVDGDTDDDGFSGMMTLHLDSSPTAGLERALEDFMASSATRSFAATRKGGDRSPDWKAEHERHPSRRNAWVLGHVVAHLVLHGLQKIGGAVKHETAAHWSHVLHGAAERVHPGAEPQVTRTTGKK